MPRTQQQQMKHEELSDQQGKKQKNAEIKNTKRKTEIKSGGGVETGSAGTSGSNITEEKKILNLAEQNHIKMAKNVTPVVSRKNAGLNWETAMSKTVPTKANTNEHKSAVNVNGENASPQTTTALTKAQRHRQKRRAAQQKYVAMDCEMVGVGLNGQDDMLARVSIVNKRGEVLIDKFVKPQEPVIDYRTSVSGIRPHDIDNGEDMKNVQDEVVQILQDKILIGHGINKDLAVLRIKHPHNNIRDTAFYKPLRRLVANGRTPSLKRLSQAILGKEIQVGEHNSVEDARAVMSIYNFLASDWEQYIKKHQHKTSK